MIPFGSMVRRRVCYSCPDRDTCTEICADVDAILPSVEQGRVDPEDLPRLWRGIMFTRALLDNEHLLTPHQQEIVRLYYREQLPQKDIATLLTITQQAVNDAIDNARNRVGQFLKRSRQGAGV
jgi:DNA-directed RNA polymerase specialized sigma24 family protein